MPIPTGHLGADREIVVKAMADSSGPSRYRVWTAEADGRVTAVITVARHQDQIAHLLWPCVPTGGETERHAAEELVKTATAHVREQGCLKLVVHTPLAASQVAGFFHHLGLRFSRERGIGRARMLEFYVDLYARFHVRRETR